MGNDIAILEDLVLALEPAFQRVSVDTSINFHREAEFAIQQIGKSDYALKLAMGNKQSVRDAVTNVAAIGISLNPARKLAYLVPRDGGICLDISYLGLLDVAVSSGSVRWAQGNIVHRGETFTLNGIDKEPTHVYDPFKENKGDPVGAYIVAKTHDGDYLTTAMSTTEIDAIKERSAAWKAWINKKKSCPWVTDYNAMALKTAVKKASKFWPKSERLDRATHHLNTDAGEGLDFSEQAQAVDQKAATTSKFDAADVLERIREAASLEDVKRLRTDGLTGASRTRDKVAYDRINAAVARRRSELSATDAEYREVAQ